MTDNMTAERVDLLKKDKSELQTIVTALGGKPTSRATKSDLIDSIMDLSGMASPAAPSEPVVSDEGTHSDSAHSDSGAGAEPAALDTRAERPAQSTGTAQSAGTAQSTGASTRANGGAPARRRRGKVNEPPAEWETELGNGGGGQAAKARTQKTANQAKDAKPSGTSETQARKKPNGAKTNDGEQKAERSPGGNNSGAGGAGNTSSGSANTNSGSANTNSGSANTNSGSANTNSGNGGTDNNAQPAGEDVEPANRRRRRRGRGRDRDDEQLSPLEPIEASGYLDLRDDGYGFLRVNGYRQSAEDVYVPVKMARQYGLRKGDLVAGTARPANRNEKNPALQTITSVNGADPNTSKARVRFEDLTPVYPFERLTLEMTEVPTASAARLVDLVAPIGKGQRCLIVAPPEAGSAELLKQIAVAIEANSPESHLMVLQFDGRPEEVVAIERALEHSEVGAATFEASPEEQCALADFTIERAKRMVEAGQDVVIVADGLTTIARAYSLGTPPTGRTITGVDASALHPTKRFFGAARKLEEAGSLTILATITVGTGSVFDEALFDEFRGTATSELHLDAWLADEGVFPNIDIELSSTRSADLLVEPDDLEAIDNLRRLMAAAVDEADGPPVEAARRLVERLESSKSNAQFIREISTATSL